MIITSFLWYILFYPKTSHREHRAVGNVPVVWSSLFLIWICACHKIYFTSTRKNGPKAFRQKAMLTFIHSLRCMHVHLSVCQRLCAAYVCEHVSLQLWHFALCVLLLPLISQRGGFYCRQGYTSHCRQTHTLGITRLFIVVKHEKLITCQWNN